MTPPSVSRLDPSSSIEPDSPLVSVVVIFKDEEQFLPHAVESVLNQTLNDWELLLVDDGSADSSTAIAATLAERHPGRIRRLEHQGHENLGMSASRNAGIAAARGRFITFLDADDDWMPQKLAVQVAALQACPDAAFLASPALYWHSWTGNAGDLGRDRPQQLLAGVDRDLADPVEPPALLLDFLANEWASLCDLLIRREIVLEVGGYEPRFRGMFEDQVFHAKLCLAHRGLVSDQWWYRYRQHPSACTARTHAAGGWVKARRNFLGWLEDYVAGVDAPGAADRRLREELATQRRSLSTRRRVARAVAARLDRAQART